MQSRVCSSTWLQFAIIMGRFLCMRLSIKFMQRGLASLPAPDQSIPLFDYYNHFFFFFFIIKVVVTMLSSIVYFYITFSTVYHPYNIYINLIDPCE